MTPVELDARLGPLLGRTGEHPRDWAERMARYLALLAEWNERINLVSRRSFDRVVEDQLLPSLAALLVVPASSAARVLDVGSGGGFPGIPLAILRPGVRLDMVDATRKKQKFLRAAIGAAGLADARAHWCRIENPADALLERAPFDVAFARAVGDPVGIAEAVHPLLAPGGALWTWVPVGTPGARPWPEAGAGEAACTALLRIGSRGGSKGD